ncbi:MAG: hypothetical protein JWP18_2297, partial [Solirubrobacterales bacterium]|nr:hypothetical protein [Solirubrobacterales bacterium]
LNVQGTTALTNVDTGAGDDRLYVSSVAATAIADRPDVLAGTLDAIRGTLNLDAGSGRNGLLVSDLSSPVADRGFITASLAAAHAAAHDIADDGELFLVGLAPAVISVRSPADGSFGGGVSIWTGSGADAIAIDATLRRDGVNVVTTLSTGLGNDEITVDLDTRDGAFVLDTQGPVQHILPVSFDLWDGDSTRAADEVQVFVDGVRLAAEHVVVDFAANTVSLLVTPRDGAVVLLNVVRHLEGAATAGADPSVPLSAGFDVLAGDEVTAVVDGARTALYGVLADWGLDTLTFPGLVRPEAGSLVLVSAVRRLTQTFLLPQDLPTGDDDVVHAEHSTRPLVLIGGVGDDVLQGGSGGDVLIGDRGRVLWFDPAVAVNLPGGDIDAVTLALLEGQAAGVAGHGGAGDRSATGAWPVGLVVSVDPAVGGDDFLISGSGADIVVGGAGADVIEAGRVAPGTVEAGDVVFGDAGIVTTVGPVRVRTTRPDAGGVDTITTGSGADLVFGGGGGDVIEAGAGADLVFGDFGAVERGAAFTTTDGLVRTGGDDVLSGGAGDDILFGQQGDDVLRGSTGDDDLVGGSDVAGALDGDDTLDGGAGDDVLTGDNAVVRATTSRLSPLVRDLPAGSLYDADGVLLAGETPRADPAGTRLRDITLLDHDAATQAAARPVFGDDALTGGAGQDLLLGGLGADRLQGGDGDDHLEGGGGDDLLFGDAGQDDLIGGSSPLFGLTTVAQRPDGADVLFGGDGTRSGREDTGDEASGGHATDADVLAGDNALIVRIVGADGHALLRPGTGVAVRGITLLDMTPGGPDADPARFGDEPVAGCAPDPGAGDALHGEAGDDELFGGCGDDALFGDGQDDALVGGWGNDWLSGGDGADHLLGDDARPVTLAVADPRHADDVLYGGRGDDVLEGGAGDDALSGAEAPALGYRVLRDPAGQPLGVARSDFELPSNPGDVLGASHTDPASWRWSRGPVQTFPLAYALWRVTLLEAGTLAVTVRGLPWLLTTDAADGLPGADGDLTDGDDTLLGGDGSDWLVGGTGRDTLDGGAGADLLDADDDPASAAGRNTRFDTPASYADRATGGPGPDVLRGNSLLDVLTPDLQDTLLLPPVPPTALPIAPLPPESINGVPVGSGVSGGTGVLGISGPLGSGALL